MKHEIKTIIILLVGVAVPLSYIIGALPVSADDRVDEIAKGLMCQCGCGKLLDVCEMETAQQMKDLIAQKLDEGWDKDRIINYLITQYGEKVLAAPTKKGFNLTAWLTPFAVIIAGASVIWLLVAEWVKRRRLSAEVETRTVVVEELEKKYSDKLEQELRDFE